MVQRYERHGTLSSAVALNSDVDIDTESGVRGRHGAQPGPAGPRLSDSLTSLSCERHHQTCNTHASACQQYLHDRSCSRPRCRVSVYAAAKRETLSCTYTCYDTRRNVHTSRRLRATAHFFGACFVLSRAWAPCSRVQKLACQEQGLQHLRPGQPRRRGWACSTWTTIS
jgi:hypothetical protein